MSIADMPSQICNRDLALDTILPQSCCSHLERLPRLYLHRSFFPLHHTELLGANNRKKLYPCLRSFCWREYPEIQHIPALSQLAVQLPFHRRLLPDLHLQKSSEYYQRGAKGRRSKSLTSLGSPISSSKSRASTLD